MLIVSKFHDYYDSITAFGIDKTVVYQRHERARILKNRQRAGSPKELMVDPPLPTSRSMSNYYGTRSRAAQFRLIGFCGKLYPLVEITVGSAPSYHAFCYTAEGAIQTMKEHGFGKLDKKTYLGGQRLDSVEGIHEAFKPDTYKGFTRYFVEYKSPVFIAGEAIEVPEEFRPKDANRTSDYILFNPKLKNWGFAAIKDPVTAFQEIYMFISGVLGIGAPDTVEIDDKHKAIAHSHDGKYSFKKPPGGGQWR